MLRIGFLTTRQHQNRFVSTLSSQTSIATASNNSQHFSNHTNSRYYDSSYSSYYSSLYTGRSFLSTVQTRDDSAADEEQHHDENNNNNNNNNNNSKTTRGGGDDDRNNNDDKHDVIKLFFERRRRALELEEKNKGNNNNNNNNNSNRMATRNNNGQQQHQHQQDLRGFGSGNNRFSSSSSQPQQRLQRPSSFQQQMQQYPQRNGGRQQQQQQQQQWNNNHNKQQGNQRYNNNNWRQQQQQKWKNNNNNNNNNNGIFDQRWAKNRGQQRQQQQQQSQWKMPRQQAQKQQQQQQQQQEETPKQEEKQQNRLAELLKELRQNAVSSNNAQQPGRQQKEEESTLSIPSWRNKFKTDNNATTTTTEVDDDNNQVRKWTRPFLRAGQQGNNYNARTNNLNRRQQHKQRRQQQNQHRDSLEFLMGNINKNDQSSTYSDSDTEERRRQQFEEEQRTITLNANAELSLTEASALLRVRIEEIQSKMDQLGSSVLDIDTLELLAMEFGRENLEFNSMEELADSNELLMKQRRIVDSVEEETENDASDNNNQLESSSPSLSSLPPRPPVVCIMGHVDHGKTTLMDALRRRAVGTTGNANKSNKKKKKQKNGGGSKKKKANNSSGGDVAGTEAGGITQIISAFEVKMEGQDDRVTFLDTPGHAAFKSMRLSGTHAADVIVLVVAADDGVSPQTVEIIDFYKSIVKGSGDGGITMVVALNKIDKPGIDVEEAQMRIENQLLEQGILCEGMASSGGGSDSEYGPPVQVIPTSGLTGRGLDDLMEGLILQSEVMDLRADEEAFAEGIVMDARMEKGLGAVVDCIVRWGSIEKGDIVVSGTQVAKVRMLNDVNDKTMKKGLPSQPVRIIGFKSLPKAGDPIVCVEDEEIAEEMVEKREAAEAKGSDRPNGPEGASEVQIIGMRSRNSHRLKRVFERANITEDDGIIRIPIIVKADADGSLSAARESLINLGENSNHDVVIDPILEGIGEVTNSDIQMAKESEAVIFVFGSKRIEQTTLNLAEQLGVTIECNEIIYSLLDDAKDLFGSYLPKVPTELVHGRGMVQAIFSVDTDSGEEKIAGMRVTEGNLYKDMAEIDSDKVKAYFRVMRDGNQVSPDGEVVNASSLRHFKELVDSVRRGEECGLGLSGFSDFEEGDIIECYSIEMKNGTL